MDQTTAPDVAEDENMHNANDLFYSPAEQVNLFLIQKEFDGEFPVGTLFSTQRHLIDAMREKATKFGFFIIDRGMAACCSETTSRDTTNTRRQQARKLLAQENGKMYVPRKCPKSKCGCEFKVNFVGMKGSKEVRISKVHFMHGRGCKPSGEQFKAEWTTGGHASRHLACSQNLKLHTIVQLKWTRGMQMTTMDSLLDCSCWPNEVAVGKASSWEDSYLDDVLDATSCTSLLGS
ncbi:hypothetical protein MHU86_19214 [Fragilaria crotonensis]|nr:hypothetical protein MHU86_19214 [Fragilaria crotonensis]